MQLRDIALNNLRRRKLKVLLLVLGLVFGVTTVVTLITITDAMKADMTSQFKGIGSKVIIKPQGDKVSFSYGPVVIASGVGYGKREINVDVLEKLDEVNETSEGKISVVAPKLLGSVNLFDKQTMLVGIDFEEELKLKSYWAIEGRMPKLDNELLIGSKVAKSFNLAEDSKLKLFAKDFIVTGVLEETAGEEDGLIFLQLPVLQTLMNKPTALTFVEVSVLGGDENDTLVDSVVNNIKERLPEVKVTPVKEAVEARKQLVDRFSSFSIVISVIVALTGFLIILSTMMAAVNERTREIGIFRAIGFRKSHVTKIIMIEAGSISLIGGLAGYLLGMVLAVHVAPLATNVNLEIVWNPTVMLIIILSSLLIGLLSAVYPAVKASRLEPADALRFM